MVRPLPAIATVVLLGCVCLRRQWLQSARLDASRERGHRQGRRVHDRLDRREGGHRGAVPQNTVVQMASDPVCAGANKDGAAAETFVVDGGGLENVFVYIKDDLGAKYAFETPATPVKIEQKGCHYVPHVAGIRAGQPLEISNNDSTMHKVHGMGHSNQEFNFSQPLPGIKNTVALTTTEVLMPVKCDVHPWMHAYIGVVNHPFFAVSAGGGKFELRDVPPGTYTVEAVHEKLGTQSQTVTIGAKENKEITFTFKAAIVDTASTLTSDASDLIWHNRFAKLVAALTLLLIAAGGMVTSTGSGLSVPDWPTTLRLEHVHVSAEQVGRRDPLRTQPSPDREHGRVPHDHPGGLDLAGRAAQLGAPLGFAASAPSSSRACSAASRSSLLCRRRSRSATPASRRSSSASR